jgi:metal-dependent amidase/aminoacylase/carboxypeptidase family protein
MMVHPAGADLDSMQAIAIRQLWVRYHGRAAHAAAFPEHGRNALDAAVLGYMNVAALRQHIRPEERIHGIFTHAGDKPNVVPEFSAAEWYVRAADLRRLTPLCDRVAACLRAGADATGCGIEIDWRDPAYTDLVPNQEMIALYRTNAAALGRNVLDHREVPGVVGSTDMGNVSYLVPSIHPMIQVGPPTAIIHTPEFATYAASPDADRAVLDGAKAMAMTIADLWLDPDVLPRVRSEYDTVVKPLLEATPSASPA